MTFGFRGREEEFAVPEPVYVVAEEGVEGLLVYQGEAFKEFFPMKLKP